MASQSTTNSEKENKNVLDEELLITEVQKYAHIYESDHKLYKDGIAKQNAWEAISAVVNAEGKIRDLLP